MMACMKSEDYRADLLLDRMRPAVNDVLAEVEILMPGTVPTCESMSQKATAAIRVIDKFILTPERRLLWFSEEGVMLRSLRRKLEEFMAVWHTVNIIEYPDNHTWFRRS